MARLRVACALVLSLAVRADAQQPAASPSDARFRSAASLVALNVSVTDGSRRFVTTLSRADFAVFEDGIEQQVSFFESRQVPVDLILLIDTSSSMSDKMRTVHDAANGFLKSLRPGDRGAVVTFSDSVQILESLTPDRARLEQAVNRTAAGGGTALNNALYIALRQFGGAANDSGEVRRRAIALLTDGDDTSSLVSFDDVMALARKAGVNVYPISLQPAATDGGGGRKFISAAQYGLKSLAQETGAQAFFPAALTELQGVYAEIAQELSSQYSIAYSPTSGKADGRFRRIVVRVVAHPELRPRARAGYTAEGSVANADTVRH